MAEWLRHRIDNPAIPLLVSGVRIPLSPPKAHICDIDFGAVFVSLCGFRMAIVLFLAQKRPQSRINAGRRASEKATSRVCPGPSRRTQKMSLQCQYSCSIRSELLHLRIVEEGKYQRLKVPMLGEILAQERQEKINMLCVWVLL
jgi:hypothetical protein